MAKNAMKSIRNWFSPEQTCQYLTQQFKTEVILSDLEDLINNNQIQLHVRLNKFKKMDVYSIGDLIHFKNFYISKDKVEPPDYLLNKQIDISDLPENTPLKISYEIEPGVYMASWLGVHKDRFQFSDSFIRGIDCDLNRIGLITIWDKKISDFSLLKSNLLDYPNYLTSSFDKDFVEFGLNREVDQFEIGFPLNELEKFVKQSSDGLLNVKIKQSLYTIIYALTLNDIDEPDGLKGAIKHDFEAKKTNTASLIIRRLQNKGYNIDATTVREHINNAYEYIKTKSIKK